MILKISKLLLLILFFTFLVGLFSTGIKDPDFWWHLKTGEYIYQHGALPQTDPFAFTSLSKDPLNPESKRIGFILVQYWLAQVLFYVAYKFYGFQGIIYLRALLLTLLALLTYKSVRREGADIYSSLIVLLPLIAILHAFTGERPQLFSFLLAFLLIYLLDGFRKTAGAIHELPLQKEGVRLGSNLLYLLPIPFVMLLWANLHGGFILGIAVIAGYMLAESVKHFSGRLGTAMGGTQYKFFAATGLISVATPFINPSGINVLSVFMEFEKGPYKKIIIESMPPLFLFRSGFHDIYLTMFFLLLALTFLVFLVNIRKLDLTDAVITTGLAAMGLSSARYIPFFSPLAVFMIVRYGLKTVEKLPRIEILKKLKEKADLSLSVILTLTLIFAINNPGLFRSGIVANNYPEGAAKFLRSNRVEGNMFNPYVWGGYLMWALYPDYKVFVDGRGLIEEIVFQELKIMEASPVNVEGLPEWKAILNAYDVDAIITYSIANFTGGLVPLIPALLQDPEWHLVYMDNISLIFVRDSKRNGEIINRFALPKEWLWNEVAVEAALKSQDYKNNVNYLITEGDALFLKQSYIDAKTAYLKASEIDPQNSLVKKRLELIRARGY